MSDKTKGLGTILYYASGTNTTAIGNVISISGPDQTIDVIDFSTMDSANAWREKMPGMKDQGTISFDVNYDGSAAGNSNVLNTLFGDTSYTFGVYFNETTVLTNKSKWSCSGFISRLGFAIPFDDKVTQSVEITMTGAPTFTDAPA
jgi:predicted secreted protein